ncbi:MAG TPA: family 16 glycoside hydrolase [Candidatus Limnocylindria bacterium]|nr:family 16 glycoside hydrolase [Candidatus Limnocylindria bacterium]
MLSLRRLALLLVIAAPAFGAVLDDPTRNAQPSAAPKWLPPVGRVLFSDDFGDRSLAGWSADRDGVWLPRNGALRAELPDRKQQHSFLYAGSETWTDYAVELDVCGMRGVDKGLAVRVQGESGIGVDLRGPGYQDVLLHRSQWPMGKAGVHNANAVWHHLRVEAKGHRYRVWVNGTLVLDRTDARRSRSKGRFALAAYTGGIGECTVYYDNVIVTALE